MKAVGIFAIDSWHLTGGHFPSVSVSCIYDDINDVFDWLMRSVNVYPLELENHTPITREMLRLNTLMFEFISTILVKETFK